jgi:hypothetical protein
LPYFVFSLWLRGMILIIAMVSQTAKALSIPCSNPTRARFKP